VLRIISAELSSMDINIIAYIEGSIVISYHLETFWTFI